MGHNEQMGSFDSMLGFYFYFNWQLILIDEKLLMEMMAGGMPYADRRLSFVSLRAKMWTVPLSLEAQRNEESWLKLMLSGQTQVGIVSQRFGYTVR